MSHPYLPAVIALVQRAGQATLPHWRNDVAVIEKADASPVTAADLAAHEILAAGLRELAPDVPVLSEEDAGIPFAERAEWQRWWLVDPLDGTKEFISGSEEFTVNVALIERGRAPLLAIDLAEGAMPSKTFVKPASVGRSDGPIFAGFVDAADAPAAPQEARPQAREEAQSVSLPTDEGGCVTKRFVIFTTPGWAPEKKGGWLKDEHLIDFLRSVMLHDDWKPGFRATVLELTRDNDLWASSATEYLSMHDEAIGPRRARKAWQEARTKHERIYKAAPKMRLGDEIDSYRKATAITHPAPDALQRAVEAIRAQINAPLTGPTHGAWDRGRIAGLKEALAALQAEHKGGA